MKIDAHYYALLANARAVGFNEKTSWQIAYASQYVDDALYNQILLGKKPPTEVMCDVINGKYGFFNMATCHDYMKIYTFNYNAMMNNTCAFHFVPDCNGNNFPKKLRCKQNSKVIKYIITEAIKEGDPVKFGLSLHPLADSYAHQGFSGLLSKVNDIKNLRRIRVSFRDLFFNLFLGFMQPLREWFYHVLDRATPAYGHAQARQYPDMPFLVWRYQYDATPDFSYEYQDTGIIDNRRRYREAFNQMREYLIKFLRNHPQYRDDDFSYPDIEKLDRLLVSRQVTWRRIRQWKTFLTKWLFFKDQDKINYDKNQWLAQAFKNYSTVSHDRRRLENAVLDDHFTESNWYRFYRAVKWYKIKFYQGCKANGLHIPQ